MHRRAQLGLGRTYQTSQLFGSSRSRRTCSSPPSGASGQRLQLLTPWERAEGGARVGPLRGAPGRPRGSLDEKVSAISHGEQRQLEIGMALAMRPRLIMLDEPSSGLSPAERLVITELIERLPEDHGHPHRAPHGARAGRGGQGDRPAPRRIISDGTPDDIRADREVQPSTWGHTVSERDRSRTRLVIDDLHVYYGDSHIVQGASMRVGDECVALLGRNGMGKTTLMRAVMGLTPARSGSVRLDSTELRGMGAGRRSHPWASATFRRGRRLFPSLTVHEHLASRIGARPRRTHGRPSASTRCSPSSPIASASAAHGSAAVSSRCSPSAGPW
jgi:ABC-type branched-subunit amino acid transport system ATPase component